MLWIALWACSGNGTTKPTDDTTPTDDGTTTPGTTPGTTDTDTVTTTPVSTTPTVSGYAEPSSITATCEGTDNALRFACHVTVDPPQPVQIAFRKSDGSGIERVHSDALAQADHDIGLYFLAPATDYDFTATAIAWPDGPSSAGTVTTGAVPSEHAATLSVVGTSSTPYLAGNLPCGSGATGAVFDTATGEMLWYEVADTNGNFSGFNMVSFTEDHTMLGQSGRQVTEIDLMGNDLLRRREGVDYVEDLHHDLIKRDGLYYLLYHEGASQLDGFQIWDSTGAELGRWWAPDHLDIPANPGFDWMHTNTIYVEGTSVYLSLHTQSTVIKVDGDLASPTFGDVEWILNTNGAGGLGTDFTVDWSAVGGADSFSGQHDVHLTSDGRLIMLDNDHGRGLVMSLDEADLTATADVAYAAESARCQPQGTATETAAGNFLVDCSGDRIQEYEPAGGTPVFGAELQCEQGGGLPGFNLGVLRWYPLDGW